MSGHEALKAMAENPGKVFYSPFDDYEYRNHNGRFEQRHYCDGFPGIWRPWDVLPDDVLYSEFEERA